MSMTGPDPETPTKVGVPISDLLAGMYGAYGVVAKLHERASTGRGGLVRTSLLASVVGVHAYQGTRWTVAGEIPKAEGPHHPSICPYGLFHSSDGIVQIAVGSEGLWASSRRPSASRWTRPVRHQPGPGAELRRSSGRPWRRPSPSTDTPDLLAKLSRDRRAQRRGEEPAAGLRLGPDPLAGSADRRRTPRARQDPAARAAAAVLRAGRRGVAPRAHRSAAARPAHRRGAGLAGRAGRRNGQLRRRRRRIQRRSGVTRFPVLVSPIGPARKMAGLPRRGRSWSARNADGSAVIGAVGVLPPCREPGSRRRTSPPVTSSRS